MSLPVGTNVPTCVANHRTRAVHKTQCASAFLRFPRRTTTSLSHRQERSCMHVGVYGSGYLGTVISACLADFGNPVSCCDTDSTRMVEMAQGNICFFEKNLKEIVRRNVRCGRLSYSTDAGSFSKKAHVIFLAEDTADHLEELVLRIVRHAIHPITFSLV